MTNTKFRKRALLSSVAMLLVALVALGSATFAWFVNDPNASASGLNAKTSASTGLLMSTQTDGLLNTFTHTQTLAKGKSGIILSPATTTNGTDYYTAEAAASDASLISTASGKKWGDAPMVDSDNGEGVYHETIQFKATTAPAEGKHYDLKIKTANMTTGGAMASAVTVALVRASDSSVTWINGTGTALSTYSGTFKSGDTLQATAEANATQAIDVTTTASGDLGSAVKIGEISAADTAYEYELYVYLDGYNTTVKSTNATTATNIITALNLGFTIVEADNT